MAGHGRRTQLARGRRQFQRGLGRLGPVPRRMTLLSIFPLLILLLALTGALADQHTVRDNVMNVVSTYLPLSDHGRASLAQLLSQMQSGSSALGALGLVGVLVVVAAVVLGLSFGLTLAVRMARSGSHAAAQALGPLGPLAEAAGALVGALGFQLLKEGFAVDLDQFAHYQAVYGSLGAAFIFFVYLSANAFILGAEVASEYLRLP